MENVLIIIHLMIVLALVGVVLVQRSEGGGLGMGGGSGFMSARGASNALTRTTAILAAAFFITSLSLGILARYGDSPSDILDRIPAETRGSGQGVLDSLGGPTTPAPNADVPNSGDTAPAAAPGASAPATAPGAPSSLGTPAPATGVPTGQ